jgi:heptosyltransferase III
VEEPAHDLWKYLTNALELKYSVFMTNRIEMGQSVAFQMSQSLGDSLLAMIVVNNLVRNGHRVVVFGDYMYSLRDWFPDFDIYRTPKDDDAYAAYSAFDVVLHTYPRNVVGDTRTWHHRVLVMDEWPVFRQVKSMVDIHVEICENELGLEDVTRGNGCQAPRHLRMRANPGRVAIHPSATLKGKMWVPRRFVALASQLRSRGFQPEFILAPNEREAWRHVQTRGFGMPDFQSLSDIAAFIYESGRFVGNDSGLAHLASNIGTPAVSLMVRNKIAKRWRPDWTESRAVLPLPILPGKIAKDRLWKYFLPVSRVVKAFLELQEAAERV